MGQCTCKKKTSFSSVSSVDLPDFDELLSFQVTASKLAVIGGAEEPVRLSLSCFSSVHQTNAGPGNACEWPEEWKFTIESTQGFIQKQKILVRVEKNNGEKIAGIGIPMWEIVTGPEEISWELKGEKGKPWGRLRANVKAQQVTKLQIKPVSISSRFSETQYGLFSLTIKYAGENEQETKHSEVKDSPNWHREKQLRFSVPTTISLLRSAALQFRVWKQQRSEESGTMIAECWLGLGKILKAERTEFLSREATRVAYSKTLSAETLEEGLLRPRREVEKRVEGTLWFCGRRMGTMQGTLRISGIPIVCQLHAGVLTEHGVLFPNTEFVHVAESNRPSALPGALHSMEVLTRQLREHVSQTRESLISPHDETHVRDLNALLSELKVSQRGSTGSFIYNNESELLEGQKLLLELGEFLSEHAEKTLHGSLYYECLSAICRRVELDLGHLALDRPQMTSVYSQKAALGVRYWTFLLKLLSRALEKLDEKGVEMKVREFSEYVCAIAYFRVAAFREQLLDTFKRRSFEPVTEWRGTTYDLEEEVPVQQLPMFDWDRFFTKYLPNEAVSKSSALLANRSWQQRLAKRGLAYFRFLSQWTHYVSRLFMQKHVPWHDIPGYHVLIKSFLLELKGRSICSYPEAMQKASISLLANPHLISVFILISFRRTNAYDQATVRETIANTSNWLTCLYEGGFPLPVTFPDAFFAQGIKALLEGEGMLGVACALWLLYRVYQILHQEIKEELILKVVLGQLAAALAFHWSREVRNCFWHFLLFRVVSLKSVAVDPVSETDRQIIGKAEEVMRLVEAPTASVKGDFYFDVSPYIAASRAEYKSIYQSYVSWLYSKTPEFGSSRKGKYGPFDSFPYPDLPLPRAACDPVDQRLSEGTSPSC